MIASRSFALACLVFGSACRGNEEAPLEDAHESAPPEEPATVPSQPAIERVPAQLLVTDPAQLGALDLGALESLDLSLSVADARERPGETMLAAASCHGLDLTRLASEAPNLRALRVSGCEDALRGGLGAFAALERLELADVALDAVIISRIAQLSHLRELALARTTIGEDEPLEPLARLDIEALELRELARDSPIARLLGEFPGLKKARLEGEWAGYHAMTALARAKRLETLVLEETSVGNFALAQIRSLPAVQEVELVGSTFKDDTPLVLRDLPIRRFACACPRFGDTGVKHVRYMLGLEELELRQSQISGASLADLHSLERLHLVRIAYRTLDGTIFAALAKLPALDALVLEHVELVAPDAAGLASLVGLRRFVIDAPAFDDACAEHLASLVRLEELDLSGTSVSDRGLPALAGLHALETLRLHHTRVTNDGLRHIAGLDRLRVLELDHTDVVDDALVHLAGLAQLEELRLDHTLVTDAGLDHLLALHELERLNLSGTVVTVRGVEKLRVLENLQALDLRDTRVSGEAVRHDP